MELMSRSLAIDDAGPGAPFTSNCDSLAFEVDIAVSVTSIGAGEDEDRVTIFGQIDALLDSCKGRVTGQPIVVVITVGCSDIPGARPPFVGAYVDDVVYDARVAVEIGLVRLGYVIWIAGVNAGRALQEMIVIAIGVGE
jgi:hypothetical protein